MHDVVRRPSNGGGSRFEQTFKNIDDVLWKEAGCTTETHGRGSRKLAITRDDVVSGERRPRAVLLRRRDRSGEQERRSPIVSL